MLNILLSLNTMCAHDISGKIFFTKNDMIFPGTLPNCDL